MAFAKCSISILLVFLSGGANPHNKLLSVASSVSSRSCCWNSAKCPFLLPNNVRPFVVNTPSSDHAKRIFLAFSRSTQRSQSFASRTGSVFKPGMGKDLEDCGKRAGGNSKNRDQMCGDYHSNRRAGCRVSLDARFLFNSSLLGISGNADIFSAVAERCAN